MGLPRLKSLYLGGLTISNVELSKRLISSCPALETLHIADCDVRTLTVESLSLKRFTYGHKHLWSQNHTMANIKLSAPNLKVFICSSSAESDKDENAETFSKLPSEEKEVLSQATDLLDCQPTRLCNLCHLMLDMWSVRGCLRAIAYLLKISPNITFIWLVLESKESNLADVGDDWEAGLSSPEMLSRLKSVQIEKAEGCDAELKLLSFLLKNAKVLEEVALFFRSSVGSPDRVKQVRQFRGKLRALPTASSKIKIMLL
ncbi:hypothetical protein C5167_029609 [Papaver somniferum]|nr:hypothetical protein C5167_029609 [Papaver somniferum]